MPACRCSTPDACIGGADDALAVPVQQCAATLFGPRGACLLGDDGPLWVADTGPAAARLGVPPACVPADCALGQADFHANAANRAHDAQSAASLHWPYGVHWDGERLRVADCGNRRVLISHGLPRRQALAGAGARQPVLAVRRCALRALVSLSATRATRVLVWAVAT